MMSPIILNKSTPAAVVGPLSAARLGASRKANLGSAPPKRATRAAIKFCVRNTRIRIEGWSAFILDSKGSFHIMHDTEGQVNNEKDYKYLNAHGKNTNI
jgi:hypothetical protein